MAENGVIGRDGALPWHLPVDAEHFRRLTTGHTVVMGRRTFESVGKPLRKRRNVIVTRNPHYAVPGATVVHDFAAALEAVRDDDEVFVCGGAEIYRCALPFADRLDLTLVHAEVEGDTFSPEIDFSRWRLLRDERHEADERHSHAFSIRRYERMR